MKSVWRTMVCVIVACAPGVAMSAPAVSLNQLFEICLAPPAEREVASAAAKIGARPYSLGQIRVASVGQTVAYPVPSNPEQVMRTVTSTKVFRGWDLPGRVPGNLAYVEELTHQDTINRKSGEVVDTPKAFTSRTCQFRSPAASGRAVFELYELLHTDQYGLLISHDRSAVIVFRFDRGKFDIELSIKLDKPIADLPRPTRDGPQRLLLDDPGPRFSNRVAPGVPAVRMTSAALMAELDRPAIISFGNSLFAPLAEP